MGALPRRRMVGFIHKSGQMRHLSAAVKAVVMVVNQYSVLALEAPLIAKTCSFRIGQQGIASRCPPGPGRAWDNRQFALSSLGCLKT